MKATKLLIISLLIATASFALQQLFNEISAGISSGSARDVAKYMNSNVDLTILNQQEVYSKAQAEVVLKDFFSKNQPKSFSIIHQGASKEGAKYAIGNLVTAQGASYRVYIFLKQASGNLLIHELRFEKS